jgi:hypothetical protein
VFQVVSCPHIFLQNSVWISGLAHACTFSCSPPLFSNSNKRFICQYQWPRGLRRRSAVARLLGLWVRIPPRAWMSVSCGCCVLSSRGLCDGPISRPGESYWLWRV